MIWGSQDLFLFQNVFVYMHICVYLYYMLKTAEQCVGHVTSHASLKNDVLYNHNYRIQVPQFSQIYHLKL